MTERLHEAVPDGQTCTIGISQWQAGQDHHDVLRAADAALYAGKETRRGTTYVAGPNVTDQKNTSADITSVDAASVDLASAGVRAFDMAGPARARVSAPSRHRVGES